MPELSEASPTIFLKDYRAPDYLISQSNLEINLDFELTQVKAIHQVRRNNAENPEKILPLQLHCEEMHVQSVSIDSQRLCSDDYSIANNLLTIDNPPESFCLEINNTIDPSKNTVLSGLYSSRDMLCTQCEAEGYRRITPGIDRPDNLAIYRVKLIANKSLFPVLLCNGNLIEEGDISATEHFAIWHDPFPKPTYLFAIVAGKLSCLEDHFVTMNGKNVTLRFFARADDITKCEHAMTSLKQSMTWDEQVYGREYDLELFNVVAVDDFNMGAMENKSLNVFNTKYVLADTQMATDTDFGNVLGVIGHEYFHNWSGNRVTCRDWFQLSLKEGFTVFRDQEFSADMGSRGVTRINDVNLLRSHQFKEDASPMAHPIRPSSYQEINNFYTATIYNKGAEVVRMLHTLLGVETFRKATDYYFDSYDGQAVTTDEFVAAMEYASGEDLSQFRNWYDQAGTPVVSVSSQYDDINQSYTLTLHQECPSTPGQKSKRPFLIPVKIALFNDQGEKFDLGHGETNKTLRLSKSNQQFTFSNIGSKPIPSILREFSAPVEIKISLEDAETNVLLRHDDDPFNRWESGQRLYKKAILSNYEKNIKQQSLAKDNGLIESFRSVLLSNNGDRSFIARLLELPSISYLSEQISPIDPQALQETHQWVKLFLSQSCEKELIETYTNCHQLSNGKPLPEEMAARSLRDTCLNYLIALDTEKAHDLCIAQLQSTKCMTDSASAITAIANSSSSKKDALLNEFYNQWQHEPLVVDKWLACPSLCPW